MCDKKQSATPASFPSKVMKPTSLIKLATTNNAAAKSFVPPVLHEVSKLAAGVAAVSAGSATGNPRNKCALQPGHSLMDWIRLGSSTKDLTGVGASAGHLNITPRQLAEHDKHTDAWLAIRGKVYNVTEYLPFHPGGPDELMRGAGRDATSLFDQIHPWVNYESILQKCFLGRLVPIDPSIDSEAIFLGKEQKTSTPPSDGLRNITSPSLVKTGVTSKSEVAIGDKISNSGTEKSPTSSEQPPMLPRFDWIQKLNCITIIFYTRAFSNVQVEITLPSNENILNIFLIYDGNVFANELKFLKDIQWPCQVRVTSETGKVEVLFKKAESKIWDSYGVLKQKSRDFENADADVKRSYYVINKEQINHNTFLMEFERVDRSKFVIPLGKHVRVFGNVNGETIARRYTPVPCSLFAKFKIQNYTTDNVCLMVKRYPQGNISRYICDRNKGDIVEISHPIGTFNLQDLDDRETFLMLAAGTGITPMLGLILFLLERRVRKCQCVTLLFFNKREEDMLFCNQLESLQNDDKRFIVETILSQPSANWKGSKGHISSKLLQETVKRQIDHTGHTKSDIYVTVCGPTVFTDLAHSLLTKLDFKKEQMHLFVG